MTGPVELIPTTTFEFLDSEGNGALSLRQKCLTCSVIYLMWATVAGDRQSVFGALSPLEMKARDSRMQPM